MDPFDRKNRIRRGMPFDDIFREDMFDFDDEFRLMHEHMNRIMREAFQNIGGLDDTEREPGKRYVYGFTMRTGADGKPVMHEFGNVPRMTKGDIPGEREPLVDVIDGKDKITVIAELPGVEREDINLNADERTLSIKVNELNRRYHKEVRLPAPIIPEGVQASYKNGILEVKLKRATPQKDKPRKKIKVD